MAKLCVNIDHVATVRQARRITEPDPVAAAVLAELGGAAGITCHLREDRRHIQDEDVIRLQQTIKTRLNLEIAVTDEMLSFAESIKPQLVMFVPENRTEITTEGGLDVAGNLTRVKEATKRMQAAGLQVSHFIDPDASQIDAAMECDADVVELHTGAYANAWGKKREEELARIEAGAVHADTNGQRINAGHGLNLRNILPIAALANVEELHIGHSIVSQAVLVGFERAVRNMVDAIAHAEQLSIRHSPQIILRQFSA